MLAYFPGKLNHPLTIKALLIIQCCLAKVNHSASEGLRSG